MPGNHARMLWFSGLRGAMAFALALEAAATRGDDGRAILTGVLGAVVFTTLVVGGLTARARVARDLDQGGGGQGREDGGIGSNVGRTAVEERVARLWVGERHGARRRRGGRPRRRAIDSRTIDRVRTTTTPRPGRERS